MSRKKAAVPVPLEQIERAIHVIRGQRVMLDSDLAELYGVPTKVLLQAVKRNRDRFPDDFAHQITQQEFINLRSQIVTSSSSHGGRHGKSKKSRHFLKERSKEAATTSLEEYRRSLD